MSSEFDIGTLSHEAFAKHQAAVAAEAARRTARAQEWLGISQPASGVTAPTQAPAKASNGNGHQPKRVRVRNRQRPPVKVLFRDPADPSHTWSGRGRAPTWMGARNKEQFRVTA